MSKDRRRRRKPDQPNSKSELELLALLRERGPLSVMGAAKIVFGKDDVDSVRIVSKRLRQLKDANRVRSYEENGVRRFEALPDPPAAQPVQGAG
jgi:predicted transcriptional regulator